MIIHSCEFFRVYIKKEGVKEGMLEFLPWIDFSCFSLTCYVYLLRKSTKSDGNSKLGETLKSTIKYGMKLQITCTSLEHSYRYKKNPSKQLLNLLSLSSKK